VWDTQGASHGVIRGHLFALRLGLMASDAVTAAILFGVITAIRFNDAQWLTMWDALGVDGRIGAAFYAAAWVMVLWYLGLYDLRVIPVWPSQGRRDRMSPTATRAISAPAASMPTSVADGWRPATSPWCSSSLAA